MKTHFSKLENWLENEDATSLVEAALLFPLFITMMMGTIDIGNGLSAGQKLIAASQTTADLIARSDAPTYAERDEAIEAGKVAMLPFGSASYQYDIVSVEFDQNDDPQVVWRETSSGFTIDPTTVESAVGLGTEGEGALIVTVRYTFTPVFSGFLKDSYQLEEVAYTRGRKSAVIGDAPS